MNGYTSFCTEIGQQPILEDLTVVVLPDGLATPLRAVIQDRVKVMANIAGRPFFAYAFDKIVLGSIKRAVVDIENLASAISKILIDNYQRLQWTYR